VIFFPSVTERRLWLFTVWVLSSVGNSTFRMSWYKLSLLCIGPIVGPIAGGFIAQTIGMKWVFLIIACEYLRIICHSQEFQLSWFVIVTCAVTALFGILLLKETYAPVICLRRAAKAQDPEKVMKAHPHLLRERGSKFHMLWIDLSRPIIILSHSFICFILSLYMAL
jgi:MFS family permease